MENKKPLYQPWNEEEFQADVFVRGMKPLQRWMYRSLLQSAFFHTTRPYLPDDDDVLWVLAGCENPEQWQANKAQIMKRFTAVEDKPGLVENKRVTADWGKLVEIRENMSELGRRSAAARTGNSQTNDGSTPVERTSSARLLTVNGGSTREEKVSEGKESKEKISNTGVSGVCVPLADWGTLRRVHRKHFNKKPATQFMQRYLDACKEYTEEIVIACFDEWAETASDWVERENVRQPLHAFFKKLPELATDELAARDDDKQAQVQAATDQQRTAQDNAIVEANVQRQKDEQCQRMTATPPPQNGGSVLEYLELGENDAGK